MVKEIEVLRVLRLHEDLRSGRAQRVVHLAGLTNADVGRVVGVSASSIWWYFNAGRRPRPATALRLAHLLEQLEVVRSAS